MDSLTHIALGAAVGMAVMGRRTAAWKAAAWGALAGTLPDLDVFVDHGDAIRNMTQHRSHSHGLFWLTLLAPLLAVLPARLHGPPGLWRRWWLALWLALVAHPLLDTMTVYGTQLLQPFSDRPFAVGSVFIIDPLYTLPLLVGACLALAWRNDLGRRWNMGGLALSTAYLAWSALAQAQVQQQVGTQLAARGEAGRPVLVTPTPFNTLLWRVVVMQEGGYEEGFVSLLDRGRPVRLDRFASDTRLYQALQGQWAVQRIAWFTQGFFRMHEERNGAAVITDLRMGQEPAYSFAFQVAQRGSGFAPVRPVPQGQRGDVKRALAWLGPRMLGQDLPPPR